MNIKITNKQLVADSTLAVHFSKPPGFSYQAGQYGDFTLINPPKTDAEGNKRTFSLASAPCEPDLMITTRIRDTAFKRTLAALPIGSELQFDGPFGRLSLPSTTDRHMVFLTGGIGVTLVRSIVTQATYDHSPQSMTLFYSNKTPADAVFMDELGSLAGRNEHFRFIPTMTDTPSWGGQHGQIDIGLVRQHIPDIHTAIYYLSGPGEMVGSMRRMLIDAGVERTNIRSDLFVGY